MTTTRAAIAAGLSAVALMAAALPAAAGAIRNGGFESGDFTGWTVSGDTGFTVVDFSLPHGGIWHAVFGEDAPGSSISQTFATKPGYVYEISFWLQLDDGATPNGFSWSWDGVVQSPSFVDEPAGFDYQRVHAFLPASGASTEISFSFVNPNSFWLLDDILVVPEPGVAVLAAAALLLMAATRRRTQGAPAGG